MSEDTKKEEAVVDLSADKAEEKATPAVEEKVEEVKVKAEAPATKDVEVPAKFKKLVSEIEEMSVLELNELVKILEEKFGVSASAVATAGPAVGAGDGEAEEKSSFTVELTSAGEQKIAVMKVVKEVLALGLKEAKELVDGIPSVMKENVNKKEAEEIKKKIEEAGGSVTLK